MTHIKQAPTKMILTNPHHMKMTRTSQPHTMVARTSLIHTRMIHTRMNHTKMTRIRMNPTKMIHTSEDLMNMIHTSKVLTKMIHINMTPITMTLTSPDHTKMTHTNMAPTKMTHSNVAHTKMTQSTKKTTANMSQSSTPQGLNRRKFPVNMNLCTSQDHTILSLMTINHSISQTHTAVNTTHCIFPFTRMRGEHLLKLIFRRDKGTGRYLLYFFSFYYFFNKCYKKIGDVYSILTFEFGLKKIYLLIR
ncbi:hypothetical protein E2C01_044481 [Portunus trituberculatus]|uniref:Uncharacterized protein n=1 Tax=Portunus trituberculatus TaxID=210409 RepID=A0A5B7FVR5_PORTR|nr:hypothetical protein [Portunus trituberculatus]